MAEADGDALSNRVDEEEEDERNGSSKDESNEIDPSPPPPPPLVNRVGAVLNGLKVVESRGGASSWSSSSLSSNAPKSG